MKARWLLATAALAPFAVAVLALQSCGGEGGPIGGGGGGGTGDTALVAQFKGLFTDSQKAGATYVGSESCGATGCHGTRDNEDIYSTWHETKHFGKNVGCESCHGPGSAHVASQSDADILTFPKITNAVVCGQCHGPIYNDYLRSGHRQIVESPVHEAATNPNTYGKSSRCISCHSGLFRTEINEKGVDVATMDNARITEIAEETLNDVPNIANCATCHNPHAQTGNVSKGGKEVQLRHLVHNESVTDINGAQTTVPTPATFTNFNHICGQCHNGRAADGRDPKLTSSTSRPNMHDSNQFNMLMGVGGAEGAGPPIRNMAHAQAPGQCSACHMPGSRHTFTVSYDKGCAPCHSAEDAAVRKSAIANEITGGLYSLRQRMADWSASFYNASKPGYENVPAALRPYLWEYSTMINAAATELGITTTNVPTNHQSVLPIQIKRARHNYYFIVRDSSICPHNPPYARHLLNVGNDNMDELTGGSAYGASTSKSKLPSFAAMQRVLQADKARAARAEMNNPHDD
ncbi:MAG: hypothetical protein HZC36_04955 [Armatimonadetes bacterium]|nr:hypothetical protein [Armatimonadota bacterium]